MNPPVQPHWSFADAELFARQQALRATPAQRLEWLIGSLEIARRSGAWARERARRDRETLRRWDLGEQTTNREPSGTSNTGDPATAATRREL